MSNDSIMKYLYHRYINCIRLLGQGWRLLCYVLGSMPFIALFCSMLTILIHIYFSWSCWTYNDLTEKYPLIHFINTIDCQYINELSIYNKFAYFINNKLYYLFCNYILSFLYLYIIFFIFIYILSFL